MHPKLAYEYLAGPWKVNGVIIIESSFNVDVDG